MSARALKAAAELFLSVAAKHTEYRGGAITSCTPSAVSFWIDLNVNMPLAMEAKGESPSGVKKIERITFTLDEKYPWSPPRFSLRQDFNRELPHIQPGSKKAPPVPCVVDGPIREFMFNAGSHEAGIFRLVEQLVVWLIKAARGTLMDPNQGWEPVQRNDLIAFFEGDLGFIRELALRANTVSYLVGRGKRVVLDNFTDYLIWCTVTKEKRDFDHKLASTSFEVKQGDSPVILQFPTIVGVIGPDLGAKESPKVHSRYFPETVETLADLKARAVELGCDKSLNRFLDSVESATKGIVRDKQMVVSAIFAAKRPYKLVGDVSDIELLPYAIIIDLRNDRTSAFPDADNTKVLPAGILHSVSPNLLRHVSGADQIEPVSILGCGSVGSKMAVHLARSGVQIAALADNGSLYPHNLARHALTDGGGNKADLLAKAVENFGRKPRTETRDLASALLLPDARDNLFAKPVCAAILTAGSLELREVASSIDHPTIRVRLCEVGLFGRGRAGFLFVEGQQRNPNLSDLMAELYAGFTETELQTLLFSPEHGFAEVRIGQGCGSYTLPMTDARLSLVTAGMTEEVVRILAESSKHGDIVFALSDRDSPTTIWRRQQVDAFTTIPIIGAQNWTFRVSARVMREIRHERAKWAPCETGGVILGVSSERTKTVTVVDHLPAPPDSKRSPTEFILGKVGLREAILRRFAQSGETLFDVGTWHSHLNDSGPSYTDRQTAKKLAAERPPPSALLIVGEKKNYGIMDRSSEGVANGKK